MDTPCMRCLKDKAGNAAWCEECRVTIWSQYRIKQKKTHFVHGTKFDVYNGYHGELRGPARVARGASDPAWRDDESGYWGSWDNVVRAFEDDQTEHGVTPTNAVPDEL